MKRLALSALALLPLLSSAQTGKCPPGWEKHPEKHPSCSGFLLPVTVKSFKATLTGSSVALDWTIGVEVNHSHYEIERSVNGLEWAYIGSAKGYSLIDKWPSKHNYYRLVSVDMDGTKNYYHIVFIKAVAKSYEVFDIHGQYLGAMEVLPNGRVLVVNKKKVYLN